MSALGDKLRAIRKRAIEGGALVIDKDWVTSCQDCGMRLHDSFEYHPYAACLMFKECGDRATVLANLNAVLKCGEDAARDERVQTMRVLRNLLREYCAMTKNEPWSTDWQCEQVVQDAVKALGLQYGEKL